MPVSRREFLLTTASAAGFGALGGCCGLLKEQPVGTADGVRAVLGSDGVVRVSADAGRASFARVHFDLPVGRDWKLVQSIGEGLTAHNEWAKVGDGCTVPWYALLSDGRTTYGYGVKICPRRCVRHRGYRRNLFMASTTGMPRWARSRAFGTVRSA